MNIDLVPIRHEPNKAGLIGAVHLVPTPLLRTYDALLVVDIGGTNMRIGLVRLDRNCSVRLSAAEVWQFDLWRHCDEKLGRDEAVEGLVDMLRRLIARAHEAGTRLTPCIGIGCPGRIHPDGAIERGAQKLPGNWHGTSFNLPATLCRAIPRFGDSRTSILMHNDAVVQGLSEVPFMQDVDRWAVFTIGTGFGNALYLNRNARTRPLGRANEFDLCAQAGADPLKIA